MAGRPSRRQPPWWQEEKGRVHKRVFDYVQQVEKQQWDVYQRFLRLAYLYNPNGRAPLYDDSGSIDSRVTENVIASNVDTVHAAISAADVRARFMTDDGDWETQRRARHLEWYADGLAKLVDLPEKKSQSGKDSALKGMGCLKIWVDEFQQIRCERVLVDNVIVDEAECREGRVPRQMHYREIVTVEEAKARFPKTEAVEALEAAVAKGDTAGTDRYWADYRPIDRNEVVIIESWYRPIGAQGTKTYVPGRHVIAIDGYDLLDEPYHKDHFPIIWNRWSDPDSGFYGIGLAERIAGHQRAINKLNLQEDLMIDQFAFPTTWVRVQDAGVMARTVRRIGNVAAYKTEVPTTIIPPAVSPDVRARHQDLRESSSHESGVSRMAAHAAKPAGLDSGAALREYRDATTERFAQQEKRNESFYLLAILRLLECAKELGSKAPEIVRRSKFGAKKLDWKSVDMGEARVQIAAASQLSKTPAGRLQLALEWAQAGVISQDEARRLMRHPDTERAMSLYTAALEHIERVLQDGLDGEPITPEPYMHLKMAVWRGQMQLQLASDDGAPENILENIRQFVDVASWMVAQQEAPSMSTVAGAPGMAGQPADPMAAASASIPPEGMGGPVPPPAGPAMDMGPAMTGAGVSPLALVG